MSHTPGPWVMTVGGGEIDDANGDSVALLPYSTGRDEVRANAHLIAAAPELLAACEAAMDWFRDDGQEPHAHVSYSMLEAAIAKARGGG